MSGVFFMATANHNKLRELITFADDLAQDPTKGVPINVLDIRQWFIDQYLTEEIAVWQVDMDPTICRGFTEMYYRPTVPYKDSDRVTSIMISHRMNKCWSRLIVVKELIHLLDEPDARATTASQISLLMNEIVQPPELTHSMQTHYDNSALAIACAVLVPKSVRDATREALADGDINEAALALHFRFPRQYLKSLYTQQYEDWHHDFMSA